MHHSKKILSAVLAASLCLSATFTNISTISQKASAATSAGTSTTLSIPDANIKISTKRFSNGSGVSIPLTASCCTTSGDFYICNNTGSPSISTDWVANQDMLRKRNVTFSVEISNTLISKLGATNNPDMIKKLFNIKYTARSKNASGSYRKTGSPRTVEKYTVTKMHESYQTHSGYTRYNIVANVVPFGTELKADLVVNRSYLSANAIKVNKSGAISTGDFDHAKSTVTCSNGQNIVVEFPYKKASIKVDLYENWLRTVARLASSVSDITGIKYDNVYIVIDDEQTSCPQCDHFAISDDAMNAVVRVDTGTTYNSVIPAMKNGQLDWGLMHEISHCFSFTGTEKTFAQGYNYSVDDVHTNVRGIVAFQNCSQLRNISLVLDGNNVGTYTKAMTNAANQCKGKVLFDALGVFGKYVSKNGQTGWNNLEKYFLAEDTNGALLMNNIVCDARTAMYNGGYDYNKHKFNCDDDYRFINSMYYLCKTDSSYGKNQFTKYIKEIVTPEVFVNYLDSCNSALGEASISSLKGDLNLDEKITSADKTLLNQYMNNTKGLLPQAVANADMNGDGYVDQTDVNLLSKK